ncbi:MAG: hypothetical protein Q4P08_03070 [Eubacteriales bacterium]|nr:hypothetical protein [Eubacteriales bacterium]
MSTEKSNKPIRKVQPGAAKPVRSPRPANVPRERPVPRDVARPRAKRPAVLLDERDRRALTTATAKKPERGSSTLGLWLMMIPLVILLVLSLVFNFLLYKDAREQAADNLKLTREMTQMQEDVQNGLSRIDLQQNEIEQVKQAIKTLESWLTDSE